MAEPFLAEVRIMSFNFAPRGWAFCNGQLLPINQNQALFALLGTTFGGDGRVSFALPNLQGRTPIHRGDGFTLGQSGGAQSHTLNISELPTHTHIVSGTSLVQNSVAPGNLALLAETAPSEFYGSPAQPAAMNAGMISNTGGSQPHINMQPFLTLNFCIALQGIFPSPN